MTGLAAPNRAGSVLSQGGAAFALITALLSLISAAAVTSQTSGVGFWEAAMQFSVGAVPVGLAAAAAFITSNTELRFSSFLRLFFGGLSYFGWVLITGVLYAAYQGGTQLPNLPLFGTVNILLSVAPFVLLREYRKSPENTADREGEPTIPSPLTEQDVTP